MKKKLYNSLAIVLLCLLANITKAQTSHPLSFGVNSYGTPVKNWYANYVGTRFQITTPSVIAGDKIYTTSNDGSGGGSVWGGYASSLTANLKFAPAGDTDACSSTAFASGYFSGKVAVIWRGGCEFGCKALKAQTAGAVAVIIVNNVSGGPAGMASGTCGGSVGIPVYMVSLADGTAIANQLRIGTTVTLSVQNWSSGVSNDLGFVPYGYSLSAYNAIPLNQLTSSTHPTAYQNKDGAFVANYGTNDVTNVKLTSKLSFTPTGSSTTSMLHADSVSLSSFPRADSIWTMFTSPYNIPTVTSTGRFDLDYNVSFSSTDNLPGDNSLTYSFYATDSIFSKGRYDLANNKPISTLYTGPSTYASYPYIWTVPYYIAHGGNGYAIRNVQFSVVNNATIGGPLPAGDQMSIYVYKWIDNPTGIYHDNYMQNFEMQLIGTGIKTFGGTDSSFQSFTVAIGDTAGNPAVCFLDSNSWYVIGAEVPVGYSLGCDGGVSGYPRAYGRQHFDSYGEYYNPIWFGDRYYSYDASGTPTSQIANPSIALYPWAFDGTGSFDIDSVVYTNQKGIIPSLPFTTYTFRNSAPTLITGTSETIHVCRYASTLNIDTLLSTMDSNTSQTLTWTVSSSPSHGSLTGFSATAATTGGVVLPSGLLFHPDTSFTGTDSFKVRVSDGMASVVKTIYVVFDSYRYPGAITGPATICIGTPATYVDTPSGGTWTSGTTSIATISASGVATGLTTGGVTLSYTVSSACGSTMVMLPVSVIAAPNAGSIVGDDTVCEGNTLSLGTSGADPGGSWTSSNTSVATVSTGGSVTGIVPGTSTIRYTVTNTCGTVDASLLLTVLSHADCHLSVSGTTVATKEMQVYPNPSNGIFTIAIPAASAETTITVWDIYGKTVATKTIQPGNTNASFDLSALPKGNYLIKVWADGVVNRQQITIQ